MSEVSRYTGGIPPLHTIKDVDTRRVLEAIVAGWRTRNGDLKPNSDERFITKGELKKLVEDVNAGYFVSGPGADLVTKAVGENTDVQEYVKRLLDATTLDVVTGRLWAQLGARIKPVDTASIRVDISQLQSELEQTGKELDAAAQEVLKIKDGTTDLVVKTPGGTTTIRAIKDTVYDPGTGLAAATAAIGEINNVSVTSSSAAARQIASTVAQVNDPSTGLPRANANITAINDVSATSSSAAARAISGVQATVQNSIDPRLKAAEGDILQINDVSATSNSANARSLSGVRAAVYDPATGLAAANAAITALNDVSATSSSASARFLHSVNASVNQKNKVFFQSEAPFSTTTYTLRAGDLWFDTDDKNRARVWNGSGWVDTSDTRIAASEAAITTEKNTRVNADNALAQAVNTIWSAVGDNSALVQEGSETVTNRTGAVAQKWNQIDAAIKDPVTGGYISSLSVRQESSVVASRVGEVEGKYSVKIDNNGYVTGFGLISTANNGAPTSAFVVRADSFAVGSAETPGIPFRVPFKVYTRPTTAPDGVTTIAPGVYIDEFVLGNGTIGTAKIGNAAISSAKIGVAEVDTLRIAGNAVTVPVGVTSLGTMVPGSGSWVTVLSASIYLDQPSWVYAACSAYLVYGRGWRFAETRLYIGGVLVGGGGSAEAWLNAAHSGSAYCQVGSVTAELQFFGQNADVRLTAPSIFMQAAKR